MSEVELVSELESHLLKLCSLEEEVIQKDQLSEALQRMKDEARDMEQEMKVQKLKTAAAIAAVSSSNPNLNPSNPEEHSNSVNINNNSINQDGTALNATCANPPSLSNATSTTPSQFPTRAPNNNTNSALSQNGVYSSNFHTLLMNVFRTGIRTVFCRLQ